MTSDPYNLGRFLAAQEPVFSEVCAELGAGHKESHWMWFIFPQLRGLGSSAMAERYAIGSLDEARAYLAHPLLGERLRSHYANLNVSLGSNDPAGYDIVVNATPLGMHAGDPLPMDVSRIAPTTLVGEVVMKQKITPFLRAAQERGCVIQIGTDMLFEQIPAYLEFFGFPTTSADELRAVAKIRY